jgi:hypothetical protein
VKTYVFRHPGFGGQVAAVPCPELSDLSDRDLKRLVRDLRHRIMIRDTFDTIERLFWPPAVSQAVWFTLWRATVEESHARAAQEHARLGFVFTGYCGPRRGPGDLSLDLKLEQRRRPGVMDAWLRQTMQAAPPKPWHTSDGSEQS